jgi:hypothetical protein
MILVHLRALGGKFEKRHPLSYESLIPGGTILVKQ